MSYEDDSFGLAPAMAQVAELAVRAVAPQLPPGGNIPFVVIPDGHKVETLEKLKYNDRQAAPDRARAKVTVLDSASFIQYYGRFADPNSRVFAYEPECSVTGIVDYHAVDDGPRWCQHRVTLTLIKSPEWNIWTASNGKMFEQAKFCEFLEQHSLDISEPSPATMREVARDIEGKTEVEFGRAERLTSGSVVVKYSEQTNAKVGIGQIEFPEHFKVFVPVFVGGPRVEMQALLRFRVNGGKLSFFYTLIRPEEVIRKAFLDERDRIATDLNIQIVNGRLESANARE